MEAMSSRLAAAREKAITWHLRGISRAGFWLAISVLALIVIAAVPAAVGAHSTSDPSTHGVKAVHALAPAMECCADQADHHSADFCSKSGHCGACAATNADTIRHEAALADRIQARLTMLPAGLAFGPAGHPPKSA